ncbi:MAG: energy transducer TonB [Pseudobacteriovorax sp.]|nr:energy transducer TonB [Pseudobacteriovorax sp.]
MTKKVKIVTFRGIPKPSIKWVIGAGFLSLLLHLFSYANLEYLGKLSNKRGWEGAEKSAVKINVVTKPKKKEEKPKPKPKDSTDGPNRILEAKLKPTAKPEKADFKGAQDHIAEKRMKTARRSQLNDADPGLGGKQAETQAAQKAQKGNQAQKAQKAQKGQKKVPKLMLGDGPVSVQPKSNYQKLLPSRQELASQVQAGYQDYIDDEVEIGDRVDFNTTSYRYIGYFTQLRKGFSQTWVYPSEAVRRGLQGQVRIEFTIGKDGRLRKVKVLETSGHKILDDAVVDAIKLSSPYSPLPESHEKENLTVVANFVYSLRQYAF